jgi:hypothetical protein
MNEREILWTKGCSYPIIAEFMETDVYTEKVLHYQWIKEEVGGI